MRLSSFCGVMVKQWGFLVFRSTSLANLSTGEHIVLYCDAMLSNGVSRRSGV